ncbi:MAG TPA: ABC transporter substrate-binding protein [Candidatus Mediterraneibacter cottocaccae]|nr:ABC transporter substrate-binding protein [Candidatus Mediterraneibacter cottocaccae]
MKKRMALLLAALMTVSMTACGNGGQDAGNSGQNKSEGSGEESYEGVTLHVAHNLTDSNADSFLAQFAAFEEKYGCKVEVEMLSSDADEMESVLQVRAATGNLPDMWVNSVGAKLDAMSPQENCYDLSEEDWIKERVNADYLEIVTDDETGAIYGVPSMPSNVAGVFYNKAAYEDLGLEIPETWDEFMDNCRIIREQSEMDPVMSQYSNASGAQILFLSQYYYVQLEDPDFAQEYTERKIELHESPAYMRGLEKMYDIWEAGYQNDNPLEISWEDAAKALAEKSAVHIFCRTNIMSTVETVAPDKMEEIGFFPLPDENAEDLGVATWMPAAWCINKNSENIDLAVKLAEFLTTEEAVDAYCTKTVPAGAFMLNGIEMPDNVSTAVKDAQSWAEKASTPVMEYYCDIKGSNLATILTMVGTGEYTPEEGISEIEADNAIDAQQKGLEGW